MPNEFPLLGELLPEISAGTMDFSIATAVLAYATGDAFGVAYEFEPLVKRPIPKIMLGKESWPAGGVSDDTLLSLMTISCLESEAPTDAATNFIAKLRNSASSLRGLGPTTRHALGIHVEEREVGIIGITNGGMMRTALLSLGFGGIKNSERQNWVRSLCSATHAKTEALTAALLMSEIFASTLELESWDIDSALEIARSNVDEIDEAINQRLNDAENFSTSSAGVSLNPIETLLAVMSIVRNSQTVWDAYENSICAGGDTDTLAALSGALVALRKPTSYYELDFINEVNWREIPQLEDAVSLLIQNRVRK
ncbi:MAG: hypothetical protein RL612_588 [Actinomycetota bacterium]|jgi:ADP-ribosylglycohydrolase